MHDANETETLEAITSSSGDAGGRGGRWFRSSGGGRARDPLGGGGPQGARGQTRGLGGRSGAGLGDHRDAAPALAWPGRILIAKPFRSYLPAVNEVSVVEFYPALRVNGRG
jgi:hypothetical protein